MLCVICMESFEAEIFRYGQGLTVDDVCVYYPLVAHGSHILYLSRFKESV